MPITADAPRMPSQRRPGFVLRERPLSSFIGRAFGRTLGTTVAGCALMGSAMAQSTSALSLGGLTMRPAEVRVTAERVKWPRDEGMGLVGTSYLVDLGGGLRFGPGIYGAISGQRGGLFTFGAEAAYRYKFGDLPLAVEAGLYAGGGGGGGLPLRDGLMLRPHIDLLYDLGPFNLGVSWSKVRFAGTPYDSNQVGLVFSSNTDFTYIPRDRMNVPVTSAGRPGAGFDRVQGVIGVYQPTGDNDRVGGGRLPESMSFAGLRAERAFNGIAYWGIEANASAQGNVSGYAEYLANVGVERGIGDQTFSLGGRVGLGMAGGGGVDTGGGLLVKGSVYSAARLSRQLAVALEAGVARAPQGNFKANFGSANLIWIFDDVGNVFSPSRTTRTEFSTGIEHLDAARSNGRKAPLKAVVLKASRFLDRNLYVTGEAISAFDGNAAGFSAGLFGLGWQQSMGTLGAGPTWHVGLEALVGAGGGGGVDVRGGALAQGGAYVGFDINPTAAVRVGVARLRSQRGELNTTAVNLALVFTFGLAGQGAR